MFVLVLCWLLFKLSFLCWFDAQSVYAGPDIFYAGLHWFHANPLVVSPEIIQSFYAGPLLVSTLNREWPNMRNESGRCHAVRTSFPERNLPSKFLSAVLTPKRNNTFQIHPKSQNRFEFSAN